MPRWGWGVIGCLSCGFICIPILAALLFPGYAKARADAMNASCFSNMKTLAQAGRMYSEDYDQHLPLAATWQDGLGKYVKQNKDYFCPTAPLGTDGIPADGTTYAFYSTLDGMALARVADPSTAVLNFETSNFARNASDAMSSLPTPGRHRSAAKTGNNLSFVDGHVRFWPETEALPQSKILPDKF